MNEKFYLFISVSIKTLIGITGACNMLKCRGAGYLPDYYLLQKTRIEGRVNCVKCDSQGRLLIGGEFTNSSNESPSYISRLYVTGEPDMTFKPKLNGWVRTIAIQGDGKILIGGDFTTVNEHVRNRIARLEQDGSLDETFDPGTGLNRFVWTMSLQDDGRILVAGDFSEVNGQPRSRLARLLASGMLDPDWNDRLEINSLIRAIAVQSSGRIVIGGLFTTVDGNPARFIARLRSSGTLDKSFAIGSGGPDWVVNTMAITQDDAILIGGGFRFVDGIPRGRFARLNASGALDKSFGDGPGANGYIWCIQTNPDSETILIGGDFESVQGVKQSGIAILDRSGMVSAQSNFPERLTASVSDLLLVPPDHIWIAGTLLNLGSITNASIGLVSFYPFAEIRIHSVRDDTGLMRLSWPLVSTARLQESSNLDGPWTDRGVSSNINGTNATVAFALHYETRFFRVILP